MDKEKIIVIIQARMGSTRLPGKVLEDIEGKPMLWHVIERVRTSKTIDDIVVATTINPEDDQIERFCRNNNIQFYRGSESNVLDRYYQAAKQVAPDCVVRITSDCPLIDPEVINKVVFTYLNNKGSLDGATNIIERTYPRGLDAELFTFEALKKVWLEAIEDYHKEHVTVYFYEKSDKFRMASVKNDNDLSNLRWTVDEDKDLKFVREVYRWLYKRKKIFLMDDILNLLNKRPELLEINKNIEQKKIQK